VIDDFSKNTAVSKIRGYSVPQKSWYEHREKILIGLYAEDGSIAGEFAIVWQKGVPNLQAYSDELAIVHSMIELRDVIASLAEKKPSRSQIINFLNAAEFVDMTAYKEQKLKLSNRPLRTYRIARRVTV
jgi:hypothetical protein